MTDRAVIRCECRKIIFDGEAVRARAVRLVDEFGEPLEQGLALCRCKRWVSVPVAPTFFSRSDRAKKRANG